LCNYSLSNFQYLKAAYRIRVTLNRRRLANRFNPRISYAPKIVTRP